MNRMCKECIRHLGANKTEKAIVCISKCMGSVAIILSNFDEVHGNSASSAWHTTPASIRDCDLIIQELQRHDIFKPKPGGYHESFPDFICNPVKELSYDFFYDWLQEQTDRNIYS